MSLLTAYEAVKYSTAGKDYPTGQFCEIIPQIEEEFARECLGQELYDYMEENKAEYPADAAEWNDCTYYDIDDVAIRNGCLFVSQTDNNNTDPLSETGNWAAFERFSTTGAQLLWTKYLRRILALKAFMQSRYDVTWRSGAGGTTVSMGDSSGFRSANKAEITLLKGSDIAKVETVTKNMLAWLKDKGETYGLPLPESCKSNLCQTRGKRVRRWAFSNQDAYRNEYFG